MIRVSREISEIFSTIAGRYDRANHILSLGLDKGWRRRLVRSAALQPGELLLDLCTGTADLIIEFSKFELDSEIIGIDLSSEMLQVGQKKLRALTSRKKIELIKADVLNLPLMDQSVDVISIAFGLRNLANIQEGLSEMVRVLRPGGRLIILELSLPRHRVWRAIYSFYLKNLMPVFAAWIAGSRAPYRYLHDSICAFPSPSEILAQMTRAGLHKPECNLLLGGVAVIYRAEKHELRQQHT